MRRALLLVPAALLVGVPINASAWRQSVTDQGLSLSWPASCVLYHINEQGSADQPTEKMRAAVQEAFASWADVSDAYISPIYGGLTDLDGTGMDAASPRNLVMWRELPTDWPAGQDVLGFTTLTYDAELGIILDADIEMNGAWFEYTTDTDVVDTDIQAAVAHEVGHFLGLDNSDEPDAIMHTYHNAGDLGRRSLAPDDAAGLAAIYPNADDPGTCDETHLGDYYPKKRGTETATGGCSHGNTPARGGLVLLSLVLLGLIRRRAVWAPLALVLLLAATPAHAFTPYATDDNPDIVLRWFNNSVTMVFDTVPPNGLVQEPAEAVIIESFQVWSDLSCNGEKVPFPFVFDGRKGGQVGFNKKGANENIIVWVNEQAAWEYLPGVLALTSLTHDTQTGEIVDADLELNAAFFSYSLDAGPNQADLKNTVVHETGHYMGLDHSSVVDATMYSKAPLGEKKKRDLHTDDIQGFCALYGPDAPPLPVKPVVTDNQGTCSASPGTSRQTGPLSLTLASLAFLLWCRRRG